MPRTSILTRFAAMLLMVAALGFAVSACGDDSDDSTSGGSTSGETSTAEPGEPVAEIPELSGVDTSVALDPGFLDALTSLKVAPAPVGDAELNGTDISFPITGGNVTYYDPAEAYRPYVQGIINHDGSGLSLTAGKTVVELTDFEIDPGTSTLVGNVSVDGEEAASGATLFDLDGSTLKPLQANNDGSATLTGTTVLLSDDAAALLNDTFGIKDLAGGLEIGVSTITVE